MAFSALSSPNPTSLQLLLDEIKFQQQKELQFAAASDASGFLSRGTTYWTDVFVRHFLFQSDRSIDADDLLFFVRKKHVRGNLTLPKFLTDLEVFRKDSKKLPIGDPEISWNETVFLNVLIHQLDYTLTLAICTRTSAKDLQVLKRHSQKVYASPSRRRMDTKGDVEEITYPFLSFMVDNFEEVFNDITVRDGEMVCVELVGSDRDGGFQAVLFLGSIRYDALKRVYDSRASLGSKMAQKMTFGLFSGSHQRVEYVRLRGPNDKGHAEIAVSKPKGAGAETPTSEPGFSMTDGIWDSDAESDSEDFIMKHHRRLSDPSSNLNNFCRSGWKSMKGEKGPVSSATGKKARSQSDGLDYCGLAEIEAGDVRDDERSNANNAVWSCCGCECVKRNSSAFDESRDLEKTDDAEQIPESSTRNNNVLYTGQNSSMSCCTCTFPLSINTMPRSQSLAFETVELHNMSLKHISRAPMSPVIKEVSETVFKNEVSSKRTHVQRHPLIPSKTIVVPPKSCALESLVSLGNKSSSIACLQDAKIIFRDKLLNTFPNKLVPSGVRVLYICDANKNSQQQNETELDDGAYNPLWAMRGFTQSFHMWRETRRAQSVPLNAFLTYISLPCSAMMKDILVHREEPVLTF